MFKKPKNRISKMFNINIVFLIQMNYKNEDLVHLERSYFAPVTQYFTLPPSDPDVLEQLLEDKRSPNTRRVYRADLNDFFKQMTGLLPNRDSVLEFLHLEGSQAVAIVLKYKSKLLKRGLKENTINRRLAAIKALVAMGRKLGVCDYSIDDVKGEKIRAYKDTSGVGPEVYKKVLAICDLSTISGKRDYALLMLLWSNALRRGEISQLNVEDVDPNSRELKILGKGRGTQKETVNLSKSTTLAILEWLRVREGVRGEPLFIALDFYHLGKRLTGDGIYKTVRRYCKQAGVNKIMSPHRVRHSSITAALEATDGNVRKVQKLSRHKSLDTLMVYDDNRSKDQEELTELLSDLTNNNINLQF